MARALVLGNGSFFVSLDEHGFVRDMHYHYVGLENHVSGNKHRIGVMVNDRFSWIDDGTWDINIAYKNETMVGYLVCKNKDLAVSLVMEDIVYNETDVFLRQVDIYNHGESDISVKIFFHQVFLLYEGKKRNTAFYDPTHNNIVHYRGRRVFIVNAQTDDGQSIDDYTVGAYQFGGSEGTYRDAEDGVLAKNAVEHGSVDSTIRLSVIINPKSKRRVYYWINAGRTLESAHELSEMVATKTPEGMIESTEAYWNAWLSKALGKLNHYLTKTQQKLFNTSLFVLRAHTDDRGSIIASGDSEMIEYGKDDYTYMWPRDAAFIASTLDRAGFTEVTKNFFIFCKDVLHPDGYLHHRFNSDRSLGSTWHSTTAQKQWLKDKILQLPIQEDETAGVLVALWNHYELSEDLEFIELIYKPMIEKMAEFLVSFRSVETGLPLPSYDLWEEKIGVSTYTCSAVFGGLMAAANFSELLGKRNHMRRYKKAAQEIREAMIANLYNKRLNSFVRMVEYRDNNMILDNTIDASSIFGLWYFHCLEQDDPLFVSSQEQMVKRLTNPGPVGGIIRYENDNYFKDTNLPNPWLITTMWEALRLLYKKSVTDQDLATVNQVLDWVVKYQYKSGVLAEQIHPYDGSSKSATPLVWSHSVYIELVLKYVEKLKELEQIKNIPVPKEL